MKRWLAVLVFLSLSLSVHAAQDSIELFGYFESQATGADIKNEFLLLFSNKLRVDLKSSLSEKVTFAANFDYITFHGKKEWDILDFLSSDVIAEVPPGMETFYVLPFSDRHFLDNAYIKLSFKSFDLTVGKQQISLGTGYVWNPTDVFNINELFDPTYEQPGHNALRLDVPLGSRYTLTTLFSPEDTWKNSAKLIQIKGRISHFDYSLIGIEKVWRFHDYTQFDFVNMNFLELPGKRKLLGASTAGELLGLGVWAEYAYNWMENSEDFYELVVGTDYTFNFQTYMMVEYYRNTLGKTGYEQYNLNDWMRMITLEQKAISRDQIYVLIQHPAADLLSVGISTIYSISDNSFALVPTLNYSLSDNVEVFAYLNINFGKEGKVFGKNMGNGGVIRARVYF
ncbi:MAG TPA: hypothetical protein ENI02_03400 [Candidatus Aminicenantes bacterium]|nr:hypothetical protein [Candidatus Aminicenantes bacterium]